jgi:hypothetical protein
VIGASISIGSAGIQITVSNPTSVVVTSGNSVLNVIGGPSISGVSPNSGYVGSTVTVMGSNFITSQTCPARIGSTASSGQTASSCNISSSTTVVVIVGPETAIGGSLVEIAMKNPSSVIVGSGRNALYVIANLTVSGLGPSLAYAGSTITVTGTNLWARHH